MLGAAPAPGFPTQFCLGRCPSPVSDREYLLGFAVFFLVGILLPLFLGWRRALRSGDPALMASRGIGLGLAAAAPAWLGATVAIHGSGAVADSAWGAAIAWLAVMVSYVTGVRAGFASEPGLTRHLPVGIAMFAILIYPFKEVLAPVTMAIAMFTATLVEVNAPLEGRLPPWWHKANTPFSLASALAMCWLAAAADPPILIW